MQWTPYLKFGLPEADDLVITYDAIDGIAADQK